MGLKSFFLFIFDLPNFGNNNKRNVLQNRKPALNDVDHYQLFLVFLKYSLSILDQI